MRPFPKLREKLDNVIVGNIERGISSRASIESSQAWKTSGCFSQLGQSSEMKIAMPRATGVAMMSARIDE